MSVDTNKSVVVKGWGSVAKGDRVGLAAMYHDNVVYHGAAGEEIAGRDALVAMISGYVSAFPDMKTQVEDVFGEGDRVFTRVRFTGTNTGALMGMPATGKRVKIRWLMNAARIQDGKVIEEWEIFDRMDMMGQLGHLPAQG